jgi:hypothetical protein
MFTCICDNVEVSDIFVYFADSNPYKRWIDDEFEIPSKYNLGRVKLEFGLNPYYWII